MEPLEFYDLKGRSKFTTGQYTIIVHNGRRVAVTKAPSGIEARRILGGVVGLRL